MNPGSTRPWILVVPSSHAGQRGAGQWKDLASLRSILTEVAGPGREFSYTGRNLPELIGWIGSSAVDVVWYYSFHPEELTALRMACPAVRLHVRTVNAEALQHLARHPPGWMPSRKNLRIGYGAARLAWRDTLCRRRADTLPGISSWDNRHYWSWLPGGGRVVDAPYVCPWADLVPHITPRPWASREDLVVCLAGGRDRISLANVKGFQNLARVLSRHPLFRGWTFALSDGLTGGDTSPAPGSGVVGIGLVDEPWEVLCRARAVTVLTHLGTGCKTTLFDALAAGCHPVAHPVLARRLPASVRDSVLVFDPATDPDPVAWHARLTAAPEGRAAHGRVRAESVLAWRSVLDPSVSLHPQRSPS